MSGSTTNINGLNYEILTDLCSEYEIIEKKKNFSKIVFKNDKGQEFILVNKYNLFKYMEHKIDKNVNKAHGCKSPDECFINEFKKLIFIIEKKFQQTGGSVCEKIQTPDFKIWQYSRTFPNYRIIYIYSLSEWFKNNCPAEIEYLESKEIPVFWGNSRKYKPSLIEFILNYNYK